MARQIFISYSKKDAPFALKLADELEKKGLNVWVDREIGGGQPNDILVAEDFVWVAAQSSSELSMINVLI